MATAASMKNEDDQFSEAFNEKAADKPVQSEDEAFGITPEAQADESGSEAGDIGNEPTQTIVKEEAEKSVEATGGSQDTTGVPQEPADTQPAVDIAKETQRLRSWEGRLKAMQKQLDAAAPAEADEAGQPNEDPADGPAAVAAEAIETAGEQSNDPAKEQETEAIAEKVESGEMTAEAAMKQLAEDFGEDFVKMIEVIATAKAKEAGTAAATEQVANLGRTVDEIIDDIVDAKAKAHFKSITAKHPDFAELAVDAQFQSYVDGLEDEAKQDAVRVVTGGNADEICALLDGYKATLASPEEVKEVESVKAEIKEDPALDQSMDDAEGVRSSGMRLPEAPMGAADDYEAAWAKA